MALKRPAKAEMRATLDSFILEIRERNESFDLDAALNPRPLAPQAMNIPADKPEEREDERFQPNANQES